MHMDMQIQKALENSNYKMHYSVLTKITGELMLRQKMLIVDDDLLTLEVHEHIFSQDYEVKLARNGQEALNILTQETFDVVVTDINMPIVNGIELVKRIRKLNNSNQNVIVIGITAKSQSESLWTATVTGMDAVLTKPIELEKVKKLTDELLFAKNNGG